MNGAQKQNEQPLFPDILWQRPVVKSRGGQLLIVGGHQHHFHEVQAAYQASVQTGVGLCRIVLPVALRPVIGELDDAIWAPSTISGSIARAAAAQIVEAAVSADAIMMGPNLSNNSETTLAAEAVLRETKRPAALVADGIGLLGQAKSRCLVVLSMSELFKLAGRHAVPLKIASTDQTRRIQIVQQLAKTIAADLVVADHDIIVSSQGELSVTQLAGECRPAELAGLSTVLWLQYPTKSFQALTSAAFVMKKALEANQSIAKVLTEFS